MIKLNVNKEQIEKHIKKLTENNKTDILEVAKHRNEGIISAWEEVLYLIVGSKEEDLKWKEFLNYIKEGN